MLLFLFPSERSFVGRSPSSGIDPEKKKLWKEGKNIMNENRGRDIGIKLYSFGFYPFVASMIRSTTITNNTNTTTNKNW